MQKQSIVEEHSHHPRRLAAFRSVKLLAGGYLGISVLTLAAIVLLGDNAAIAPAPVWVRGIIVVVHAGITLSFIVRMMRGSRIGYMLLRLSAAIMFIAIVVIIALPGGFPLWFKIEQGFCGLLLLGIVAVINGKHVRSAFATK